MSSFLFSKREYASNSIKVIGVMSRCYKVYPYLYKQSNYTRCVSEILEQKLTIKKEYSVAKLGCEFIIVKSLDKYEQRYLKVSAIIVANATYQTTYETKQTTDGFNLSRCNNSICNNGIITPNSTPLSPSGFCLVVAKVNTKKHKCFFVVSKKFIFYSHS